MNKQSRISEWLKLLKEYQILIGSIILSFAIIIFTYYISSALVDASVIISRQIAYLN